MFWFRGVAVWLALLFLLIKVAHDGVQYDKQPKAQNLYTPKKTLSEMVPSSDEEPEIEAK